jgi:uncharacterized membrane protein
MDPLLRLADEVSELSYRLELVSSELRGYSQDELTRPIRVQTPVASGPPKSTLSAATDRNPDAAGQRLAGPVLSVPQPPVPAQPYPAGYQAYTPPPPRPSLMERLGNDGAGSRLLAWVGGAVTLLGVVLLLVLAVQRGWLGPLPRVLGGAALGGALIGIGLWVHRSPNGRTGAFALAATGIAALYLDAVAATVLFDYLPTIGGLVAGLLVAVGGLLLAARWDSHVLGTAVVVGSAICAPLITQGFTPLVVGFLLMLQIATTPIQLRKNWPSVALAAGAAPLVASALSTATAQTKTIDAVPNAWAAFAALIVGVALALISVRRRVDDQVAVGLLVWAAGPALISAILLPKDQAVTIAIATAVVMLAVWVSGRVWPRRMVDVAAMATLVAGFQATATAFDGTARSLAILGEAALLAMLGLRSRPALWGALGFGIVGTMLAVLFEVRPTFLVLDSVALGVGDLTSALVSSLLILAVAVLLPWVGSVAGRLEPPSRNAVPWVFAGFAALYGAAGLVLSAALLVDNGRDGFLAGHVVITVSWTVAALVLLLRGIRVRVLRVVGLVLVGAAVTKLILFDLSALDGLARVAAFLGAGLILLAAGTKYARMVAATAQARTSIPQ